MTSDVCKGQAPDHLERSEFSIRFRNNFVDPAFCAEDGAISRIEQIAWEAYEDGRKAPITRKAGAGYADPGYASRSTGSPRRVEGRIGRSATPTSEIATVRRQRTGHGA